MAYSFNYVLSQLRHKYLVKLFKFLLMLLFVCLLVRTRERASEWQTEEKLFSSALKVCPKNAKVHYNIARLASDEMKIQKALFHYHKAIGLFPKYESALMNLGNLYREVGDLTNAEKYIKASLEVMPDFATAWMNLGITQSAQRRFSEALSSYENALKYRKKYAICHYNMGNLFLEQKLYSEAMHHWQESIALNPNQPRAWANILTMLDNRGLLEDAMRLSEQALNYLPNDTSILFIRANILGKLKNYIDAENLYKRVIKADPTNVLFHTNLGVLYHRWEKPALAIESYQNALKINPTKATTAKDNLEKLLKRIKKENGQ